MLLFVLARLSPNCLDCFSSLFYYYFFVMNHRQLVELQTSEVTAKQIHSDL